MSIFRI